MPEIKPLKTQTITSHYANYHCLKASEIAEMCRSAYGYLHARPQAPVNTMKCVTGNMLERRSTPQRGGLQRVALRTFEAIKRIVYPLFSHLSSSLFNHPVICLFCRHVPPSLGVSATRAITQNKRVCATIKTPYIALRARPWYTKLI